MIRIHFVGGEKGGVGKSVLSRVLAQYYIDRNKPFKAFDGDLSHGALARYYGEFTVPIDVNSFESIDQIVETCLEAEADAVVDLAAQSQRSLDRWISESGVVDGAGELGLSITMWHVMDDGTDSVRLLDRTLSTYGAGPAYVVVRNRGRGKDFSPFDDSETASRARALGAWVMDLPELHAGAMRKIDRTGASLWAAANNRDESAGPTLGMLERQRVRVWLNRCYEEIDRLFAQARNEPAALDRPCSDSDEIQPET